MSLEDKIKQANSVSIRSLPPLDTKASYWVLLGESLEGTSNKAKILAAVTMIRSGNIPSIMSCITLAINVSDNIPKLALDLIPELTITGRTTTRHSYNAKAYRDLGHFFIHAGCQYQPEYFSKIRKVSGDLCEKSSYMPAKEKSRAIYMESEPLDYNEWTSIIGDESMRHLGRIFAHIVEGLTTSSPTPSLPVRPIKDT
jgi:hypothetical protein